jgi:hypothetical protein
VVEIRSSLSVQERYDTNPLSSTDPDPDFTTLLVPSATARWRGDRGSLAGLVELTAKRHQEFDDLDGLDRTLGYDGSYALSPRLTLQTSGRFWHFDQTDELVEVGPTGSEVVVFGASPDLDAHYLSGTASYQLSRRTSVSFTPSVYENDYADPDEPFSDQRTDSRSLGGRFRVDRALSPFDTVFVEVDRNNNEFSIGSFEDTTSQAWEFAAGWTRTWDRLWQSTISLGVNRLATNQTEQAFRMVAPPGSADPVGDLFVLSSDDTTLSGVGTFSLSRHTRRTLLSLTLSQQVSPTSGYGSDVTVRSARSRLHWQLNSRWALELIGDWSRSQTTAEEVVPVAVDIYDPLANPATGCPSGLVPIFARDGIFTRPFCLFQAESDAAYDFTQLGFATSLNWQMSKRFSTFLRYRFSKRTSTGDQPLGEFDNNAFWLGFTYRYDVDLY